ncbi:alpha/beta fold hydrolase [Streptosporangium sp. NPDC000396]|uniref:alpha/beta fold hydrolase n=1 Tax=Streptosporangium sp. NPDC000396 TaxID=3366185 RepID=UPI0036B0819A
MLRRIRITLGVIFALLFAVVLYTAYGYRPAVAADYTSPYLRTVNSQFVETPLARFHYVKQGSGSPIVLLSPGASWVYAWREQLPVLARDHTVYVVDLPGQGFTTLHDRSFTWDLDGMTRAVGTFLDAVKLQRVGLAGNSWSGGWALAYAQRHPERVGRLALLDSSGLDEPDIWAWEIMKYPVIGELMTNLGFASEETTRAGVESLFVDKSKVTDELVKGFWATNTRLDNLESNYLLERGLDWGQTEAALPKTMQPTLVVWGKQDTTLVPAHAQRFGELLPDARVHMLDGCGHAVMLDCPKPVNDLMSGFFK